MKIRKRNLFLIAAIFLYCAWAVSPALAHAELVRSVPAADSVLQKSPPQVELIFSEAVESNLSTIKVYDSNGSVVDKGDAAVDPSDTERMTVSLPPLPDGLYTVTWQVISEDDGHLSAGSFAFAVGNISPSSLPAEQSNSTNLPLSALIAKWLLLAGAALVAGIFPSKFFVWDPALKSNGCDAGLVGRLDRVWDSLYLIGLVGVVLAFTVGVLSQAGQATGHELAAPWSKEALQVLTVTRLGAIWLTRLALALFGFWLVQDRATRWKEFARFAVGLALLLTVSLTSHASTEARPFVPLLTDWLHLIGMSIWFSGLACLIGGLAILQKVDARLRMRFTSSVTKRFSWLALPSVAVIGLTGLYSAVLRVGTWAALFNSNYGDSLLVKQVFVAGLLILAGINFLFLSPRIQRDGQADSPNVSSANHFRKTLLGETVLACLLLASVSVMTYLPPAATPLPRSALIGNRTVDGLKFALTVTPGLVGQNSYTVRLGPARAVQAVSSVSLSFVPVKENVPPSDYPMTAQGNGVYTGQGTNIGFPGEWLVEVTAQREGTFDAVVTFDFNVPQPGSGSANESSGFHWIAMLLIGLNVLLIGLNLTYHDI